MASSNPFAAPKTDAIAPVSTDHDRYIESVAAPMLEQGERLRYTAYMIKAPPLWAQILFMGLIMMLLFKYFLVAVTDRRIILIRTKNFWMKPKMMNLGTEEIRWDNVRSVKVGGIANNRSIDFQFNDGTKRTLRIAPWAKFVSGQAEFFKLMQSYDRAKLS